MKEKELQLVTFEQAKRLEIAGFDYINKLAPIPWYDNAGNLRKDSFYPFGDYYVVPTVALALEWMRDEKGYESMVHRSYIDNTKYLGEVYKCNVNNVEPRIIQVKRIKPQNSHEAADSALLDAALTILEEEKEQWKK